VREQDPIRRIQSGLRYIERTDKTILGLAIQLGSYLQLDLLDTLSILKSYSFRIPVSDTETKTFHAEMSAEQHHYLKAATATPQTFLAALAKMLVSVDQGSLSALKCLVSAVHVAPGAAPAPAAAREEAAPPSVYGKRDGGIGDPPLGCCYFDTSATEENVTQSLCEGGLQGDWVPGQCGAGRPPR